MRYTNYFLKTQKEMPAGEDSKNAELLIRAGFIRKEMAGVYSYLPLGLRVLRNIEQIIREEMDNAGVVELLMPGLSSKENWEKTGRWDTVDVLYKMMMANGHECALNPTHEETVTPLAQQWIASHKDCPKAVYQIQSKFRNEPRAKSGILRGREFLMKDAYSFHTSQEDFETYYENMTDTYMRIYDRIGLGEQTKVVSASGGAFSADSHEFQTLSSVGEDTLFYDKESDIYYNEEVVPDKVRILHNTHKAIEVGNIFPLGTKFSDSFKFTVIGEDGKAIPVIMGCYGIGISRLMGTLVEVFHDEKGIIWPKSVAPFDIYLAAIGKKDDPHNIADEAYTKLKEAGYTVLYDDRKDKKVGPGQKLGDAELIGLPYRVVISERNLEEGIAEIAERSTGKTERVPFEGITDYLKANF